jgi:phosphoribosylglycinamide formyltransferase-1
MDRPKVAILASGEGTTAEAFIIESAENRIKPEVVLIISNNKDAGIFKRVDNLNKKYNLSIKTTYIGKNNYPANGENLNPGDQTKAEEEAILKALEKEDCDLIALMGYMKRIGPKLVHRFGWRSEYKSPYSAIMVNTHPGLLPETKGLYGIYVQKHVLDNKLPYGGQTLHIVAKDYDEGPVISEHKVEVKKGDTPDELFNRVKLAEKKYLPKDIANFIENRRKYTKEVENK